MLKDPKMKSSARESTVPKQADQRLTSPLFKLPEDVRTEIFDFVLVEQDKIKINHLPQVVVHRRDWQLLPSPVQEPALLRSCQQAHAECAKIYYSQNTFHITVQDYKFKPWIGFVNLQARYGAAGMIRIGFRGEPDWETLVSWLTLVYITARLGKAQKRVYEDTLIDVVVSVVQTLASVTDLYGALKAVEPLRRCLVLRDKRWDSWTRDSLSNDN